MSCGFVMKIRKMCEQDLSDVAKVHQEVFLRQTMSQEWIACNFRAYPRIEYFVAEDEGKVVGYIQWIEKSGFRKEAVLELEQIGVLPSKQRMGVGSLLISESLKIIKDELRQRNSHLKNVLVSTRTDNHAQQLYEKTLKAQPEVVIRDLFSADEVLMIARNPLD